MPPPKPFPPLPPPEPLPPKLRTKYEKNRCHLSLVIRHLALVNEVVRAVDRQPAVARVPDRGADHRAAAHGVADKVIVQAVAAEHAFFAEPAEFGVADRPLRISVI